MEEFLFSFVCLIFPIWPQYENWFINSFCFVLLFIYLIFHFSSWRNYLNLEEWKLKLKFFSSYSIKIHSSICETFFLFAYVMWKCSHKRGKFIKKIRKWSRERKNFLFTLVFLSQSFKFSLSFYFFFSLF